MTILDSLIENLEAEGLLKNVPRTHVVVGYSGGADSTALLFLLAELKTKLPLDVTAAYFNHRWRGTPPTELPLVHQNCLQCNIPLVVIQADLTIPKTENAARQARYKQLTRLAYDLHADAVLTAHHADDQIETLLFRLFRGTGVDGLNGIQKRLLLKAGDGYPVPIMRPLLDVSRKSVREYIREKNLTYFDDPTNRELKFQRNNIRHQVLPLLEQSFPQVKNSLFRLSLVAEGDLHIIEESVQAVWKEVYGEDKTSPYLEAIRFNQLGLPYQRRVLKRFLSTQHIHPDFQTIEDLLLFIRGEGRRNLDSSLKSMVKGEDGKTRFLALYKDRLRLIAGPKAAPAHEAIAITVPGIQTFETQNITFKALPWQPPEKIKLCAIRPNDSQQVFVDLSAYADKPLELRNRKPGDKFQPMGMEKPMRFKKFLINRGVPRFDRDQLWVLAHGNQILWAPGLGISQELRVKDQAQPTHLIKLLSGLHPEPENLIPLLPQHDEETESSEDTESLDSENLNEETNPALLEVPDTEPVGQEAEVSLETQITGAPNP